MESGLEGRNNLRKEEYNGLKHQVSMESGLEGRNNNLGEAVEHLTHRPSQWSPA